VVIDNGLFTVGESNGGTSECRTVLRKTKSDGLPTIARKFNPVPLRQGFGRQPSNTF